MWSGNEIKYDVLPAAGRLPHIKKTGLALRIMASLRAVVPLPVLIATAVLGYGKHVRACMHAATICILYTSTNNITAVGLQITYKLVSACMEGSELRAQYSVQETVCKRDPSGDILEQYLYNNIWVSHISSPPMKQPHYIAVLTYKSKVWLQIQGAHAIRHSNRRMRHCMRNVMETWRQSCPQSPVTLNVHAYVNLLVHNNYFS